MSSYIKSLSTDFGGQIDLNNLHDEIKKKSDITKTLVGIVLDADEVIINFDNILSGAEETSLLSLSGSHLSTFVIPKIKHVEIFPEDRKSNSSSYKVLGMFQYLGSSIVGAINYIDFIGKMDKKSTSYDVQIIDKNTNTIVAQGNYTNTNIKLQSMGTISNIPVDGAILEISLKVNGTNKNAEIQELIIYYGNE